MTGTEVQDVKVNLVRRDKVINQIWVEDAVTMREYTTCMMVSKEAGVLIIDTAVMHVLEILKVLLHLLWCVQL